MEAEVLDMIVRRSTKVAVLPAGLVSKRRPGDVVILLYHRLGNARSEIELPTLTFDRQMRLLARHQPVRPLDRALEDGGGVVVTFDDGTKDFYTDALPALIRHQVPATLYLATGAVGRAQDALRWEYLSEAVATGLVTIGSHTHNHADLSRASEPEAEQEMRRSREMIEDRLGVACPDFAYPWGVASPSADRVARRLFATAALDGWRTNRRGRTDPHRLGRVPVLRSDSPLFFRAKAGGRLDAERLAYRVLGRGPWRRS